MQLLNTLFSGKTTSIRRFHALCNSVIVIDKVQTVPNQMLTLFNLALNFLPRVCNTTFVLCSATQPCLESADHPLPGCGWEIGRPHLFRQTVQEKFLFLSILCYNRGNVSDWITKI